MIPFDTGQTAATRMNGLLRLRLRGHDSLPRRVWRLVDRFRGGDDSRRRRPDPVMVAPNSVPRPRGRLYLGQDRSRRPELRPQEQELLCLRLIPLFEDDARCDSRFGRYAAPRGLRFDCKCRYTISAARRPKRAPRHPKTALSTPRIWVNVDNASESNVLPKDHFVLEACEPFGSLVPIDSPLSSGASRSQLDDRRNAVPRARRVRTP